MENIKIKITEAAREYGYIIWHKNDDININEMLKSKKKIKVKIFNKIEEKNIDWKKRRISIGYSITRTIDNKYDTYIVKKYSDDTIEIKWC